MLRVAWRTPNRVTFRKPSIAGAWTITTRRPNFQTTRGPRNRRGPYKCAISKASTYTYQVSEGTTQQKPESSLLLSITNGLWGLQGVKISQRRLAHYIKGTS